MWHWIVETERLLYSAPIQVTVGCGAVIAAFVAAMCLSWWLFEDRCTLLEAIGFVLGGSFVAALVGGFLGLLAFIVVPMLVAIATGFGLGWAGFQISRIFKVRKQSRTTSSSTSE